MSPDTFSSPDWLSARSACRILGISRIIFRRVVDAGNVRIRRIPGTLARYSREDIERIAIESVQLPRNSGDGGRAA